MSSYLKQYLNENKAPVAGAPDVGVEEHTEVATTEVTEPALVNDAPVYFEADDSVANAVDDLEQAEIEQTEIEDDVESLGQARVALERYSEILHRGIDNGGVSRETAEVIAFGMEQYNTMLGVTPEEEEELVPSLEAFGGSGSRFEATKKMANNAVEKIKKLVAFIKGALKALVQAVKSTWQKINVAGIALKEKADKLAVKAAKLDASTLKEDTITIKGSSLFADGKYKGKEFEDMAKTVTLITASIPAAVAKSIADHAKALEIASADATNGDKIMDAIFTAGESLRIQGFKKPEATDGRGYNIEQSDILPDNQRVYVTFPVKGESAAPGAGIRGRLSKTAYINIGSDKNAKKAPDNHQVKVASPAELASHAKRISKMAQAVIDSSKGTTSVENSVRLVEKAVKSLEDRAAKVAEMPFGNNAEELGNIQSLINSANASTALQSEVPRGNAYLVRVLNAMLAVVERQMSEYAAPKEANA